MPNNNELTEMEDPIVAYYRTLRNALIQAKRQPELQNHRFQNGVEQVVNELGALILERRSPTDLDEVRKLDPELRDGGILFALDKLHDGDSGDLGWLADRLAERGGAGRVLSDPDIRTITDLEEKLSDYEVWRA